MLHGEMAIVILNRKVRRDSLKSESSAKEYGRHSCRHLGESHLGRRNDKCKDPALGCAWSALGVSQKENPSPKISQWTSPNPLEFNLSQHERRDGR